MSDRLQLAEMFGARLAEARALRKLSQRTLGEGMGMSKKQGSSRINRYERGGMFVSLKSLETMARVLEVPVASLLAETPEIAKAIRVLASHDSGMQQRLVEALLRLASEDLESAQADESPDDGTAVSPRADGSQSSGI